MCTVRENVEKKDYRNRDSRPLRGFEASGSNLLLLATRGGDQAALLQRSSVKDALLGNRVPRIKRSLQSGPLVLGMREDTGTATTPIVRNYGYRAATSE
jgi:hypothetical protein